MTEAKLHALCREIGINIIHKNSRGWLVAPCPFAPFLHEFGTDRNPSFNLHVNHEGYSGFNCWTCKQKGNLTKLISRLGDLRGENYSKIATKALIDETPENFEDFDQRDMDMEDYREISPIEATIYLRMYPLATETPEAVTYLKERGVTRKAAELCDLRFDPDQKRILFPVYDWERKLYGFTGRTILGSDEYPSDKYPKVKDYAGLPKGDLLLGEHLAQDGQPMIVVEGLFALLSIISRGVCDYANPVATMGSRLSEAQRDRLVDHDSSVFMLYDGDKAGLEGLWGPMDERGEHEGGGAVDLLTPHLPTFVCTYPEETDDPDDLDDEDLRSMVLGDMNEQF
jgi:DNA primase